MGRVIGGGGGGIDVAVMVGFLFVIGMAEVMFETGGDV